MAALAATPERRERFVKLNVELSVKLASVQWQGTKRRGHCKCTVLRFLFPELSMIQIEFELAWRTGNQIERLHSPYTRRHSTDHVSVAEPPQFVKSGKKTHEKTTTRAGTRLCSQCLTYGLFCKDLGFVHKFHSHETHVHVGCELGRFKSFKYTVHCTLLV